MFTGLVETTGEIIRIEERGGGARLTISCDLPANRLKPGASLAVNGCCLTVVSRARQRSRNVLQFDLLEETLARTSFPSLRPRQRVNLESPLSAAAGFHGHFVTGHVEDTGRVVRWEPKGADWILGVQPPKDLMRYIVPKGSIAVDGISLTVARASRKDFEICIIPHTLQVTNLSERKKGDLVNLETDILAKHVERLLEARLK